MRSRARKTKLVVLSIALLGASATAEAQLGTGSGPAPHARRPPPPRAKVVFETAAGGSSLNMAIVRRYLRRTVGRLRLCYEAQLRAGGKVPTNALMHTSFTIGADGRVLIAHARGVHSDVARCVANVIRQIRFPQPQGKRPMPVYYPLRFQSPGFGFGRSGLGPGSGAPGLGVIGIGRGPSFNPTGRGRRPTRSRVLVSSRSLSASGTLDRVIVWRYIRRKVPAFRHCYDAQRKLMPRLTGVLAVRFTISQQGAPLGVKVTGVNAAVAACVRDQVASMRFPRPKAGVVAVQFPMTLAPPVVTPKPVPGGRPDGVPGGVSGGVPGGVVGGRILTTKAIPPPSHLHETMRTHAKRIRGCYLRALAKNKKLRGKVTAKLVIDDQGKARSVTAWGMTSAVSGCVAYVLRQLTYPPNTTKGRAALTYTFTFQSAP